MDKDTAEIKNTLEEALYLANDAYETAREVWGENDPRSEAILGAWAETSNALKVLSAKT